MSAGNGWTRIPVQTDHSFRWKPDTDSGANRTVIPVASRSFFRFAPERCEGSEVRMHDVSMALRRGHDLPSRCARRYNAKGRPVNENAPALDRSWRRRIRDVRRPAEEPMP